MFNSLPIVTRLYFLNSHVILPIGSEVVMPLQKLHNLVRVIASVYKGCLKLNWQAARVDSCKEDLVPMAKKKLLQRKQSVVKSFRGGSPSKLNSLRNRLLKYSRQHSIQSARRFRMVTKYAWLVSALSRYVPVPSARASTHAMVRKLLFLPKSAYASPPVKNSLRLSKRNSQSNRS